MCWLLRSSLPGQLLPVSGRRICHDMFTEAPLGAHLRATVLLFKSPLVSLADMLDLIAKAYLVPAGTQLCRHHKAPAEEWAQVCSAP